ncbi:MAG: peptidoglycan-binding domain-containing protein [Acidimicrobiia bacterium]
MSCHRSFRWVLVASVSLLALAACGSSGGSSSSGGPSSSSTSKPARKPPRPPNSLLSVVQIKTVQTDLTTVKCFSGALDGVIGPVTRAGIAAFQQADSLTVNSQFGPETKTKLMAAAQAGTTVCTVTPATTTTTTSATAPPCTSTAIQAALPAGSTITDFGCDGEWAWAGVDVDPSQGGYEATDLLKANGTTWQVVDRATNCNPSVVPPDIYNPGCTTN